MRPGRLLRCTTVVAASHVVMLGLILGLRPVGYALWAALSAAAIWGVAFFLRRRERRSGLVAGLLAGLAIEQALDHAWAAEWPGLGVHPVRCDVIQVAIVNGGGRADP